MGAGIYLAGRNLRYNYSLTQYKSFFEMNITYTDSQAEWTISKVASTLVWESRERRKVVTDRNTWTLYWVPGFTGKEKGVLYTNYQLHVLALNSFWGTEITGKDRDQETG